MNAILLGYGTVGKGVEILCQKVKDLHLEQVFVRPSKTKLPYFSSNGKEMVTRKDIDIVFECLNGIEPANTLITLALKNGKHVITSNKAVVSHNLKQYVQLAEMYGGSIQIEACVAGGIPFLDAILKLSELEDINGYTGIFNGTCNFILDQMQNQDLDFDFALKKAQELGYAEADPTSDVEGFDVFYKANITNMLAFKTKNEEIHAPIGISKINKKDIALAKSNNKVIRHIAKSVQNGNEFTTIISPIFLNKNSFLANVPNNYNAQLIYAHSFDQLGYYGQGAGQLATAQAMLANAIDTLHDRERKINLDSFKQNNEELLSLTWLIRSDKDINSIITTEKRVDNYYWVKNKNASIIDTVLNFNKKAMIALWEE